MQTECIVTVCMCVCAHPCVCLHARKRTGEYVEAGVAGDVCSYIPAPVGRDGREISIDMYNNDVGRRFIKQKGTLTSATFYFSFINFKLLYVVKTCSTLL